METIKPTYNSKDIYGAELSKEIYQSLAKYNYNHPVNSSVLKYRASYEKQIIVICPTHLQSCKLLQNLLGRHPRAK